MKDLLKRLRVFVQSTYDLTLPRDMEEGQQPFGLIDYYGMEDLLRDIDAQIEELEKPR